MLLFFIMLTENIISVLEDNDMRIYDRSLQSGEYYRDIEFCTPAGEDVVMTVWYDGTENGFVEAMRKLSDDFDVDEHVELNSSSRGENGVPDSIRTLVEDAEWIDAFLSDLADELEGALDVDVNNKYGNIRDIAYTMYKIDWINSHISAERQLEAIRKYYKDLQECISEGYQEISLEEWIEENGFDGEIYACYDEFCENEYVDMEYMHSLLKNENMITNYDNDVERYLAELTTI